MARSTRLVILIKNIYTLWGRKRFLPPVTYFPTGLEFKIMISAKSKFMDYTNHDFFLYEDIKDALITVDGSPRSDKAQCAKATIMYTRRNENLQ